MKNSLELQITNLIKKANKAYTKQDYLQSLRVYDEALEVFHENKIYNTEGQTNFKMEELQKAQENFNLSLQIAPHDSLTLIRRATLYCKVNRPSEAIEDVERAQICDPEGESLRQVLNSIRTCIQTVNNVEERERLMNNFASLKAEVQEESEVELKEDEVINFSKLKKIDRISFSSNSNRTTNKLSSFQIEYENDQSQQISENLMSDSQSQSKNQNQLNPVEIVRKNGKKKSGSANFRKMMSLNEENSQQKMKRLASCTESFKSIDGNLERRSSVKFIDQNNVVGSTNSFERNSVQSKEKPVKRKSCLRISKTLEEGGLKRKTSSFMEIKNIDGNLIPSSFSNLKEQSEQKKECGDKNENENQFSDSEEENNEHNIYGQKSRTKNLNNWSGKNIDGASKGSKKKSILKKNSVIGSEKETSEMIRSIEHKKSVCFQDQNSSHLK